MKWLNFLHLYQPANQQRDILEAVVKESYFPLFEGISKIDNINISINITGALFELFERDGYTELLDLIRHAVKSGKVELTGGCKFHAFIPLLPLKEIERQIVQNEETLSRVLGFEYKPKGFFPTEMGYYQELNPLLEELGYEWVIIDEISQQQGTEFPAPNKRYILKDTDITVFFRNRRVSNLIMSAVARDIETLHQALKEDKEQLYLVTGMDGETFGHHRIGHEKLLFEMLNDETLNIVGGNTLLTELSNLETEEVMPKPSTWASSINDIENNVQFLSWNDPENNIHKYQWEFLHFTLDLVYAYKETEENYQEIRAKMDIALASDHFWWASAKPWWSLEMIEDGAFRLFDVVKNMNNIDEHVVFKAYRYYQDIVSTAAGWQRDGTIRKMATEQNKILRIPFKERTLEQGGPEEGVYHAFIDMMKEQEKLAAEKGEYEKAILWRDAVHKIDKKYDIYDAINVIDLIRIEIGNGLVEETINKYKEEYKRLRGGQPEQRGS